MVSVFRKSVSLSDACCERWRDNGIKNEKATYVVSMKNV